MGSLDFIAVSGFFSSGSSAVVDLIKEYSNTFECTAEIRIIKDPYGLTQLEHSIVDNWELLNSAASINDYLWLCKICSRNNANPFSPVGLSYSKKISKDFMDFTYDFIDSISQYKYKSDFFYQKFKKNYFSYVLDRWRMGVEFYSKGTLRIANRKMKDSYFAHPTKEQFEDAAKDYLERVFGSSVGDSANRHIILDQAVSTNDSDAIHRYFRKCKMIIVDRDPRDMYIEDSEIWRENLDSDVTSKDAGTKYVLRHQALRENIPVDDPDVLSIRFESLVLDYENTKRIIEEFLGFQSSDHLNPYSFLKPQSSSKNVGIWKKYYNKYRDALDEIYAKLPSYCFTGKNE